MKKIGIYDINEHFDYKTRLQAYKTVGFTEVGLYLDENYMKDGEIYAQIIDYAREIGLEISQVHVDYQISNLICDENNNEYFDYVEAKMRECYTLKIPYMVLHASKGNFPPTISALQIKKLEKVVAKYPEVCLCFENVRNNTNLELILQSKFSNIKMCFDLGHAHAYSNEYQLFEKFKHKIVCAHVHNNFKEDTHNIPSDGEIDCKFFVDELAKMHEVSICLECFPKRGERLSLKQFKKFLQDCFNSI